MSPVPPWGSFLHFVGVAPLYPRFVLSVPLSSRRCVSFVSRAFNSTSYTLSGLFHRVVDAPPIASLRTLSVPVFNAVVLIECYLACFQ